MIQYQNYDCGAGNVLDEEAADWARHPPRKLPVDDRDVLDKRRKVGLQPQEPRPVEIIPQQVTMQHPERLVELVEIDFQQIQNLNQERTETA